MPYSQSDYPDSMKNLDENVRLKAIDIVNAMLEEGYQEENAIPIAIDQAKEWIEDASKKELKQLKEKNLTDHQKADHSDSARLQEADVRVSYHQSEEKWAVKSVGAKQVDSYHSTKKEAVDRAEEIAENRGSRVIKEKKDDESTKGG